MTYTVKKGDTLSEIGAKFGVSVDSLVRANGIPNKNMIRVGQVLTIPGYAPPAKDNELKTAFTECLAKIENLPEFKKLEGLLNG